MPSVTSETRREGDAVTESSGPRSADETVSVPSTPSGDAPAAPADAAPDDGPVPRFDVGDDPVRARRLLRLRVALKAMVAVGVVTIAFVLVSAFLSGEDDERALPALRVVVGDMAPGETRTLTWDGRAVLVRRRTSEEIDRLEAEDGALRARLRDPDSARSEQPPGVGGALRSVEPEWFVAIGLGTDYGCPVGYLQPEPAPFAGAPWPGGFVDGCRRSRYDLAGRVYAGQYADRNLVVPPHAIVGDALVLGG